jgi:hypothetical protein
MGASRSTRLGLAGTSAFLLIGTGVVPRATADVIPADRLVPWQDNVGVEGGIPARTNVRDCGAMDGAHADGVDTSGEIQACLDNTPTDGVAYLPAGLYSLGSPVTLTGSKTLRGAGPGQTVLLAGDIRRAILLGGQLSARTAIDIVAGYTKGSTVLVLADASTIEVGAHLRVDELNDASVPVTNIGYGTCTWCGRESGARVRGQFVKVLAKASDTITISPPMFFTFSAANLPQVQGFNGSNPSGVSAELAGIEDLTVRNDWHPSKVRGSDGREYSAFRSHTSAADGSDRPITGADWGANWVETGVDGSLAPDWQPSTAYDGDYDDQRIPVDVASTSNCWLKNVEIDTCGKRCVQLFSNNYRFELRDSRIAHCINRWDSDNCYGTLIGAYATGTLIENNIYDATADGPMFAWNASGNVVAYNYVHDAHRTNVQRSWFTSFGGSHHGAHTAFNLWEGNELESLYFDQYWGSHAHNIAFRNRVLGNYMVEGIASPTYFQNVITIATERHVRYQSYVGNVLGSEGFHDTYERNSVACSDFLPKLIYRTGYASSGNCTAADSDAAVFSTMLRHRNFDYVSNGIKSCFDAGEPGCQGGDGTAALPGSLYLTGKPSWFGNTAWPPIDPVGPSVADIPAKQRFWAALPRLHVSGISIPEGDAGTSPATVTVTVSAAPPAETQRDRQARDPETER